MKPIKTIGHSNHPIERFVELLKAGGVERLVDVRSVPGSRRFPQFGRERLKQSLLRHAPGPAAAILDGVLQDVTGHRGRAPQKDDLTLVVLKRIP